MHTTRPTIPRMPGGTWRAIGTAAALGLCSCPGHKSAPDSPVASLARSTDAQSAFQGIRARWLFATLPERLSLEAELRAFRDRFGADPLARVASVYLAFIYLQQGRLDEAGAMATEVEKGSGGNTKDLARLVQGARLVKLNEPEQALRVLEPLEGKLLDDFADDLLYEAIVEAAVRAHRWLPAARWMNAWLRDSDNVERKQVRLVIDEAIRRFPPDALEDVLQAVRGDPRPDAWDTDMRAAVAVRLGQIAVERADSRLARSVLETSRSVEGLADAGSELQELASIGARTPTVSGRTVGLVVPTADQRLRPRAAEAIQGALQVLDPATTAQATDLAVLRMRDCGSELEDVITSLDALAQDGAAIAIAGFDPETASAAAGWAEAESMPVIVLARPSRMPQDARFVFVLGEDDGAIEASAASAARQAISGLVARVVPAGQAAADLAVPCDAVAPRAGDMRFPFHDWKGRKVAAITVTGPASCASDVLSDLHTLRWQPLVVLGLPAIGVSVPARYGGTVLQATAGRLGEVRGTPLDDPSLASWRAAHGGSPGWFAGLGHDAALLASLALRALPPGTASDPQEVSRRRAAVQQALLAAACTLWTTLARGFEGQRVIAREIRYEPASRR